MELSAEDIRLAAFDEVEAGGWDPSQVRSFLDDVAKRVIELEQSAAEADEMRRVTVELLSQAEDLVEQARAKADEPSTSDAIQRGAALIAKAEARALEVESDAASRLEAAEHERAAAVERGHEDAATIVANARREALSIIEQAEADAAGPAIAAFADGAEAAAALHAEAEQHIETARVEAAAIVAEARAEAQHIAAANAAAVDGEVAKAEVDKIVEEAEALLVEARANAEHIVEEASQRAAELRTEHDLSDAVRRSVAALHAVTEARAGTDEGGALKDVRGRAVQMLAELRRTDSRLAPTARADLLDELFEVQDIVRRIEARLIGHDEPEADGDRLVVDLTDEAIEDPDETGPQRRSRYQQRSANLPKIGADVDEVTRAVRSIRRALPDRDLE